MTDARAKKIQEAARDVNSGFALTKKEGDKAAIAEELPQNAVGELSEASCAEKLLKDCEHMFDKTAPAGAPGAAESIKDKMEVSIEACAADKGTLAKMRRFGKSADNSK